MVFLPAISALAFLSPFLNAFIEQLDKAAFKKNAAYNACHLFRYHDLLFL